MRLRLVPLPFLTALLLLASLPRPAFGGPGIREEPGIALEIDVLLVEKDGGRSVGTAALEVLPGSGGEIEIRVPWPESGGGPASLRLQAKGDPRPAGEPQEVALDATLSLRSGRTIRATRSLVLAEGAASLFEVFGEGSERLVLAIRGERVTRPVVRESFGVGAPVRFHLAVERIDGERATPVETNDLSSFLGESVEYSFRRGEGDALESLRLVLTVRRILGDVAEVETDVSASLPGPKGPILLSHQDRLFATRGAISTVTAVTGTPAAGYRFLVTPTF